MEVVFEIVLLLATLALGVMWAFDQSANYEPIIVLCGGVLAVLELMRRQSSKQRKITPEAFAEVSELLKELKSARAKGLLTLSPKGEQEPKSNPDQIKLQEFFRQNGQIEKGLVEIAKQGGSKVGSALEAVEVIAAPEIFREAMCEYLHEGEKRISESFVYLDWALKLGKTVENIVENRLSKGAWG